MLTIKHDGPSELADTERRNISASLHMRRRELARLYIILSKTHASATHLISKAEWHLRTGITAPVFKNSICHNMALRCPVREIVPFLPTNDTVVELFRLLEYNPTGFTAVDCRKAICL